VPIISAPTHTHTIYIYIYILVLVLVWKLTSYICLRDSFGSVKIIS